jgi:predicted AAA+ superfamily ATPase
MIKKSTLEDVITQQRERLRKNNLGLIRPLLGELTEAPEEFALIISGIRRCGKSTLLNQYISKHLETAYLYLNFDTAKLYTFDVHDFQLLDEIIQENSYKWLLFDEIQIINGWEVYVRQKIDEGFRIVITGSNASLLSKELGTKLTGRHITKELFPFSFKEYCAFNKIEKTENAFVEYMNHGGFPGYLKAKTPEIHSSLLDDILYRDIAVRHNIRDIKSLKHLLIFLATNIGKPVSANKLKQVVGVKSTATISEYFNYFEDSYLIQLVSKFSYSQKVQMVNPKKIYFIDSGLQNAISGSYSRDLGRKLENIVFWELRKQNKSLNYYNENAKECDFVVSHNQNVECLIQVCHTLNKENEKREISGLIDAMDFFKKEKGIIITLNQEDKISIDGKSIQVIPVFKYF